MKSWTLPQARAWLFVVLFLVSFLFVRIYDKSPVFFIPSPADDTGYLAYTESILRGHSFDWCEPAVAVTDATLQAQCKASLEKEGRAHAYNFYAPGPALVLLPVTAFGHWLDRWGLFRPSNVDPLLFWSIVGTFLLFALGSFLLFECTLHWLGDIRLAWWMTLCYCVGNPVVYFVFHRPLMSHATEYFLFFAEIYLLIRLLRSPRPLGPAFLLGAAAGLMVITRLNNVHIPALLGILLLFWPGADWAKRRWGKVLAYLAGAAPVILLFLWINYLQKGTFLYSTQNYYEAYTIGFFLKLYLANPLRVLLWFVGPHWGLLWLLPLSTYQLYYFWKHRRALWVMTKGRRLPLALLALVLLVHLNMMANGPTAMSYAYRYVFTYYFLFHVGFLIAQSRFGLPRSNATRTGYARPLQALLLASALVGAAHFLNYETKVPSLRPQIPLLPARAEWIFHPYWKDMPTWTTPYFALHSYVQMLKGTPVMALAASPALALPVMLAADSPLGKLPGLHLAVDYFRSENRKVYSARDLALTYEYEAAFGLAAAIAALLTRRWRRLSPARSPE